MTSVHSGVCKMYPVWIVTSGIKVILRTNRMRFRHVPATCCGLTKEMGTPLVSHWRFDNGTMKDSKAVKHELAHAPCFKRCLSSIVHKKNVERNTAIGTKLNSLRFCPHTLHFKCFPVGKLEQRKDVRGWLNIAGQLSQPSIEGQYYYCRS